ncbi:MAG: MoxR family ATPase [Eubacteriales bacterium]|nr:MoxR family ATPase [Eubacteriales bacterium]
MNQHVKEVLNEVNKVIIGKEIVTRKVLMALLSDGHVLLEDVPGVGKTTMALAFSKALGLDYKRIQLTPDVMPSDIVGFYYYNKEEGCFEYKEGSVITQILLADELNRTSSRTQSALLEAMEEGNVTVDGHTHKLPEPFFVIATQNPTGSAGTQTLPQSQLDRFMVMLTMGYPDLEEEIALMQDRGLNNPLDSVKTVLTGKELIQVRNEIQEVEISPLVYQYIAMLAAATREHEMVEVGVSPRGSLALCRMAKAGAYLSGRDYVIPEDVQAVVADVFGHRLLLKPRARLNENIVAEIMKEIVASVSVPDVRSRRRGKE